MPLTESQKLVVQLTCYYCKSTGIPILLRTNGSLIDQLGAYCFSCKQWLRWVRQSGAWLVLETEQAKASTETEPHGLRPPPSTVQPTRPLNMHDGPDAPMTPQEEEWIAAIADMGKFCYDQADKQGFHDGRSRQPLELCMLVVTELAELAEAFRKGQADAPSDHIPEFTYAEEEWADVLVRVFDHSYDHVDPVRLGQAFVAKLAYNRTRGYRHGGKTI